MSGRRSPEDDWMFDPVLAALDRSLRRELRDEAEEVEAIVAQSELRSRHVRDVANESRNRGDRVAIATSRRTFNGQVSYAGRDFLSIVAESYEADVNLDEVAYLRTLQPGAGDGSPGLRRRGQKGRPVEDGPGSFEMRLIERQSTGGRIELGYRNLSETLLGSLAAVGQDHVIVTDSNQQEWVIPFTAIAYVVRHYS